MDVKPFVAAACLAVSLGSTAFAEQRGDAPHAATGATSDGALSRGYELLFPAKSVTRAFPSADRSRQPSQAPLWTVLSGPGTPAEPTTKRLFDTDRPRNLLIALRAGF